MNDQGGILALPGGFTIQSGFRFYSEDCAAGHQQFVARGSVTQSQSGHR